MNKTLSAAVAGIVALCSSCAAKPAKEFSIDCINTNEENVSCLIFQDGAVVLGKDQAPLLTPAKLPILFVEGKSASSVKITLRAVELDPQGRIVGSIEEGAASPYLEDVRYLYESDSPKQVFVLRRNKTYEN